MKIGNDESCEREITGTSRAIRRKYATEGDGWRKRVNDDFIRLCQTRKVLM